MVKDAQGYQLEELIRILETLFSTPTWAGEEMELLRWLADQLANLGFNCGWEEVESRRANLVACRGNPRFLLATHADTVPAWGHPYALNPRREGDRVWARGAVDAKGQLAALLFALGRTEAPCALVVFVDEEQEATGSERFVPPWGIEGAVVLEPTNLQLAIAQAGNIEISLEVQGRAAHGSVPQEGVNAIELFWEIYQALGQLPFLKASHPLFSSPRITLGRIEGGISPQVVPDRCWAELDFTVLPPNNLEGCVGQIASLLGRYPVRWKVVDQDRPWVISSEEPVVRGLAQAFKQVIGRSPTCMGINAWTDAANLLEKGLPTVVFGAGRLGLAHTPEEHVDLGQLSLMADVLRAFLELQVHS